MTNIASFSSTGCCPTWLLCDAPAPMSSQIVDHFHLTYKVGCLPFQRYRHRNSLRLIICYSFKKGSAISCKMWHHFFEILNFEVWIFLFLKSNTQIWSCILWSMCPSNLKKIRVFTGLSPKEVKNISPFLLFHHQIIRRTSMLRRMK